MDRDDFDKFRTRGMIAHILDEIWRKPECVAAAVRLAEGSGGRELLAPFVAAVLGDLLHNLRVISVKTVGVVAGEVVLKRMPNPSRPPLDPL